MVMAYRIYRMRITVVFFLTIAVLGWGSLKADEGMWLLPLIEKLNMPAMKELGFKLTAEDIYSINHTSLKDAIVIFGSGCTGEIVSEDGLIFTNHHCGFEYIQDQSTLEHDYIKDGFWAKTTVDELPNPGLEVRFLKRIEDVTEHLLSGIPDSISLEDRSAQINDSIKVIEKMACENDKFEAEIVPFFAGNSYYLFVYQVYKDVRLVGTPPSSIGNFGHDTDNWEWPRHAGDFSIFRAYTAPDGSPAEYSPDNIPLKPACSLSISLNGVSNGDMAFVLGYPGNTNRYISSSGVREIMDVDNVNRIKIRTLRQDILTKDMQSDPMINLQYASKYAISSNFWKYCIGQNRQLDVLNVLEKKQIEESEFNRWVNNDSLRIVKYGNLLAEMDDYYRNRQPNELNFNAISESFFLSTELIGFVMDFQYLYMLLQIGSDGTEEMRKETDELKAKIEKFYKDYNVSTDIKMAKAMFSLYRELVPEVQQPDIYERLINKKFKGNIDKFIDKLYTETFFLNRERTIKFLENPTIGALQADIGFKVTNSIFRKYYEEYSALSNYKRQLANLDRLYMSARMEMYPDSNFYPDANSTMRLSYGKVMDYDPADAVHYDAFTSLKGVMEKEDIANIEFIVPEKLKQLYLAKDYGRYGKDGIMPVCFITNNDITGGSSGSPVLNNKGELIGLAFDGNWEAMSSDISYEPEVQRSICVDIRYVLFIIDKFAGDGQLINELKIVP
jgi:hypothetical protein